MARIWKLKEQIREPVIAKPFPGWQSHQNSRCVGTELQPANHTFPYRVYRLYRPYRVYRHRTIKKSTFRSSPHAVLNTIGTKKQFLKSSRYPKTADIQWQFAFRIPPGKSQQFWYSHIPCLSVPPTAQPSARHSVPTFRRTSNRPLGYHIC